jgi:hypothetical protein
MTTLFGAIEFLDGDQRTLTTIGERNASEEELIRRNNDALATKMRVAIPAEVISFDEAVQTVSVQPLIQEKVISRADGTVIWTPLPVINDVPVLFPQAGNFILTMPIQPGDVVQLLINDLCLDAWYENGGQQNWMDRRRHDLSDAVAIPGLNAKPQAEAIAAVQTDAAEFRTKDRTQYVRLEDDQMIVKSGNNTTITIGENSVSINQNGTLFSMASNTITMQNAANTQAIVIGPTSVNVKGTFTINGFSWLLHAHGGVAVGGGQTTTGFV